MLEPGEVIAGRFVLERLAGQGGMGSVWRARDRERAEAVAVKVQHRRLDRAAAERFSREAQVLAELHHPGIVRYVAHGATPDGAPFLAMEWIDGETLDARAAAGPLRVGEAVALLRAVADALAAVHARGIVHRDLKPQNLMLPGGDVGAVKLVDFGIARWDDVLYALTGTGVVLGSFGYMAPEQARGVRDLDARVDVYALGCLAFEALTGRRPFLAETTVAALVLLATQDAPRARSLRGDLPDGLDALLASMLERDPARRPAHGAEVVALVDALDLPRASEAPAHPSLSGEERREVAPRAPPGAARAEAPGAAPRAPFVGRERELHTLDAVWNECAGDSVARAVLVTGSVGSGKTRLRAEWLAALVARGPAGVLLGVGDPAKRGVPRALAAAALRRACGIAGGEGAEARRSMLRARVGRRVAARDVARVTHFLGELTGAEFADEADPQLAAARRDPKLMNDQVTRAWVDWLAAECAAGPVAMVLDDAHLGDRPSFEMLEASLRALRDLPWMLLVLARPDDGGALRALRASGAVQELPLGDLSRRAAERLARAVLGDREPAVERALERAGGNPYLLEQLLRAVSKGDGGALPATVREAARARFDALDAPDRRLLRAASVYGRGFTADAVAALAGPGARADERLDALVLRDVLQRREGAGGGYAFRHEPLREAAYEALTDDDRALGHRLAAAWLERAGDVGALTLAEHFEKGRDAAAAASWWLRAAERALDANDLDAAVAHAERGARAGAAGETLGALRGVEAMIHSWRGELDRAAERAAEAVAGLRPGGARWYRAAGFLTAARVQRGDAASVAPLVDALVAPTPGAPEPAQVMAASQLALHCLGTGHHGLLAPLLDFLAGPDVAALAARNPLVAAYVCEVRATRATVAGDPLTSMREKARAHAFRLEAGDLRGACVVRVNEAFSLLELGDFVRAEELLTEALGELDRFGLAATAAYARLCLGLALLGRDARLGAAAAQSRLRLGAATLGGGVRRDARAALSLAVTRSWERGRPRTEALARCALAAALALDGELEAAEREASTALERAASLPSPRSYALATRASVRLQRGATAEALDDARDAMRLLDALGGLDTGDAKVRRVYAEALRASGDAAGAAAAIDRARARLLERAARIEDEGWRECFLERVEDNARTLALAREWGAAQREGGT